MLWRFFLNNLIANGSPLGMTSAHAAQMLEAARRSADDARARARTGE